MAAMRRLVDSWDALPVGARAALDQQWAALAAGGLPCGAAVVHADGRILAAGRNRAYDPPGGVESRARSPLEHTRLAHAELNALALLATEDDHAPLILWSTQHPCAMRAAAVRFVGIGHVRFVADDPSDDSPHGVILATRGGVPYEALGDPLWWTISNLLFLYNSARDKGEDAPALTTYRNLRDWAPPAIHLNSIAECMQAMGRIRDLAHGDEGRMCPGHDGEVCRRFPEITPGVYRLA